MKLDQYNQYIICTVDTAGFVLLHQGIGSHNVKYETLHCLMFMG